MERQDEDRRVCWAVMRCCRGVAHLFYLFFCLLILFLVAVVLKAVGALVACHTLAYLRWKAQKSGQRDNIFVSSSPKLRSDVPLGFVTW